MQKRVALSLLLALALGACGSSEPAPAPVPAPAPDVDLSTVPCTCGDEMTAVLGCAHPKCAAGETNPDNPDCVCGPIALGEENQ
jgi:hypothetical protein